MSVTRQVLPEFSRHEAGGHVAWGDLSIGAVVREMGLYEMAMRRWGGYGKLKGDVVV